MLLPTINKTRGLLQMDFIGDVDAEQIRRELKILPGILEDLPEGFILIVNLENVGAMPKECAPEIGLLMDFRPAGGTPARHARRPKVIGLKCYSGLVFEV